MPAHDVLIRGITENSKTTCLHPIHEDPEFMENFTAETRQIIHLYRWNLYHINRDQYGINWVRIMTSKAMEAFTKKNRNPGIPYVQESAFTLIYQMLWNEITQEIQKDSFDLELIKQSHRDKLISWFQQSVSKNEPVATMAEDPVMAEYAADFQLKLMDIDPETLSEPILDLGCGRNSLLVKHLREKGKDAFGIDRNILKSNRHMLKGNGLAYNFKPQRWGTVISNLSFSLHFENHHNQKDCQYFEYARKYMDILDSLKTGGSFYYTPGLPFIEAFLPKEKYKVFNHHSQGDLASSRIIRL